MDLDIDQLEPEEYYQMIYELLEKKEITIGEFHQISAMIRLEIKLSELIYHNPVRQNWIIESQQEEISELKKQIQRKNKATGE